MAADWQVAVDVNEQYIRLAAASKLGVEANRRRKRLPQKSIGRTELVGGDQRLCYLFETGWRFSPLDRRIVLFASEVSHG